MKRLGIIVLLLAGGCGVHLGDKYGRRMRAAFDAQIARSDGGNAISGEDAKSVMRTHMGRGNQGSLGSQTGTSTQAPGLYISSSQSNNSGPSMRTPTADSPIRLDAVR
jgi:hypothetical protein